jgi:hypothetical protein
VIENNKYQNIEIKGPSIIPSIYCMAVRKGNTQLLNILNNGISELRRNGKLTEIQEKWKVYEKDDFKISELPKYWDCFYNSNCFINSCFYMGLVTSFAD